MRRFIGLLIILTIMSCETKKERYAASGSFKLAVPQMYVDSLLFNNSAEASFQFDFPDSQIRYTINEEDVTETSNIYKEPLKLSQSTIIKTKSFHPDFKSSDQTELRLTKINNDISDAAISIKPEPHSNYPGNGNSSLTDMQKGALQFRNGKKWLGFQSNPVSIDLKFNEEKKLSKVVLSTLLDQNAWVFSPRKITIFSGNDEIGRIDIEEAGEKQPTALKFIEIPVKQNSYPGLRVVVHSLDKIPEWHQGTGTQPWLFIDELIIQ